MSVETVKKSHSKFEIRTNNMFNKELLLIVTIMIAFTHQTIKTDSEIPVSFRKVGNLAAGLSYAHIHGTLDFAKLKEGHDHIEEYLRS